MPALNFPSSPTLGQVFTGANKTWTWDGAKWIITQYDNGLGYADLIDAKGDLLVGTALDTIDNLTVGANNTRLVADSAQTAGLKWVADSVNTVVDAKGDLLVGTAADTVSRLAVSVTNGHILTVDSAEATGVKWAAPGATKGQAIAFALVFG